MTVLFLSFIVILLSYLNDFLKKYTNVSLLKFTVSYDVNTVVKGYYFMLFVFFILNFFKLYTTKLSTFLLIFLIYVQPVIIIPITYLIIFNTSSLICLSLTQKKSLVEASVNDCITTISFCLRFLSQYIRIILITFVFILFYEYLDSLNLTKSSFLNNIN